MSFVFFSYREIKGPYMFYKGWYLVPFKLADNRHFCRLHISYLSRSHTEKERHPGHDTSCSSNRIPVTRSIATPHALIANNQVDQNLQYRIWVRVVQKGWILSVIEYYDIEEGHSIFTSQVKISPHWPIREKYIASHTHTLSWKVGHGKIRF